MKREANNIYISIWWVQITTNKFGLGTSNAYTILLNCLIAEVLLVVVDTTMIMINVITCKTKKIKC